MEVNKIITDKDKAKERTLQWRLDNPERYKKYNKRYYLKNRKKKVEYSIKYYYKNREKALKDMEEWRKRNPKYQENYYQKTKLAYIT